MSSHFECKYCGAHYNTLAKFRKHIIQEHKAELEEMRKK